MNLDRRGLLLGGGAGFATLAVARNGLAAAAKDPFTLGVASGDPAPDGFVIWTRLAPEPLAEDGSGGMRGAVPVTWEIATDEAMTAVVRRGTAVADGGFGHSVHVEVAGLRPARPYWYRFSAQGHRSRIGRAKTAPALGAPHTKLTCAFASCSHYETGYFAAYRHMADEQADLIFFLGDYMYETSHTGGPRAAGVVRPYETTAPVETLAQYRNRYATHHLDEDLAALHAASPALMTWDDHEVQNDYANKWSQDMAYPIDRFLARRAAAYRAYYENMPLRRGSIPRGPDMRVYDRLAFGDLASISVMDGRQYRSEQPCRTETSRRGHFANCLERLDSSRTMLGAEQERWLYDGFRNTKAKWNIMAQDLLIAPFTANIPGTGLAHYTDGWDGYPATRARMLRALADARTPNPVFFGGDIHSYWVTDLKADYNAAKSDTVATEFIGTSVTSDNLTVGFGDIEGLKATGWVKYVDAQHHGYMTAEITPGLLTTRHRVISDRRDKAASVSTSKTWVVESGKAGAVEA